MPAEVETMVSVRQVPWHGLGTIVQEQLTAEEALREAGLDWEVAKRPVYVESNDHPGYVEIPNQFANVRTTDGEVLGIVGKQYRILQNREAFAFADSLVDDGSAKYETAGSLRGGRLVWLMMELPDHITVGDDEVKPYLALRNSHDGTSAITAMVTPVRIVCQNTLNLAIGRARTTWSVRHSGEIEGRLQAARDALELTFEYLGEFQEEADRLIAKRVSDQRFEAIASELSDVEKHAEGMISTWRESDNLADVRGTAWGAVNAVGEYWEHHRETRSPEAALRSTMNGQARKMRDRTLQLVS